MYKYVRTPHLKGSKFQNGDHDLSAVSWNELAGKHLVVEEKLDGANVGISFENGKMKLQSRGHYLTGGPRERHFDVFKQWSAARREELFSVIGDRYVMYGEYLYAKHTMFYDALPHYFMEFDILEKSNGRFLSTDARRELIESKISKGVIVPVLVLDAKKFERIEEVVSLLSMSHFVTSERDFSLARSAESAGVDLVNVKQHTDPSLMMEGLYIKWEENGIVKGRYKYVRSSFTNAILDQDEHWLKRPIVKNMLEPQAYDRMFA